MELRIDLSDKKTVTGVIILICAIALILYAPNLIGTTNPELCTIDGVCQHEERVNLLTDLVPVFILSGIIIGAGVFFIMTSRLEDKEKNMEKVAKVLLQFLSSDEKKIVEKIIEHQGRIFQSEISRIEGIGKLKSHRILQKLEDRGVIEVEKHGKTNIIKLEKNIRETVVANTKRK